MLVAILTLPGFNEIDSFVALNILGRVRKPGWAVKIAAPEQRIRSMNDVIIERGMSLEDMGSADAVIVGSGTRTGEFARDRKFLRLLPLDLNKQLIASQCSGALILDGLGLLSGLPVCTDEMTKPTLEQAGIRVLDQPLFADGNLASAGGCLASQYLAGWIIARLVGVSAAEAALRYVAPAGEKEDYVARAMENVLGFIDPLRRRSLIASEIP